MAKKPLATLKNVSVGEVTHSDVCGPMEETSIGGAKYTILFKD